MLLYELVQTQKLSYAVGIVDPKYLAVFSQRVPDNLLESSYVH